MGLSDSVIERIARRVMRKRPSGDQDYDRMIRLRTLKDLIPDILAAQDEVSFEDLGGGEPLL